MVAIVLRPPPAVFLLSAAFTSVSASSAPTMPTSVKSIQSDDPPTFRFTNVQDLFDAIDHTSGDSLTVTNVSRTNFTKIERTRENQGRKFRFRDYDSNSQILIVTITTDLHEELHKQLYNEFVGQVRDIGLKRGWRDIGNTTRSAQGYSGRSSKEGDSTGSPRFQRAGKGAWPTLIIEAGFSQSLGKLHIAIQRWFSLSNHEVKIVLLAKFSGTTILLEKWEEEVQVRPRATTTRYSRHYPTPILRQSITITRNTTTNPTSYNVTSGALVLSFQLLFLKDPGLGEGDFILSVQELEEYAEMVWAQV